MVRRGSSLRAEGSDLGSDLPRTTTNNQQPGQRRVRLRQPQRTHNRRPPPAAQPLGNTLCRVLEAAGNTVNREYYINDGVNSEQMRLFAESVRHYYHGAAGIESTSPRRVIVATTFKTSPSGSPSCTERVTTERRPNGFRNTRRT